MISFKTDKKINLIESHQNVLFDQIPQAGFGTRSEDWGAFQKTYSYEIDAIEKQSPYRSVALTTSKWYNGEIPQLYVPKKSSYLQISGSTRIEGDLYVPFQTIKTANVAGYIYEGNTDVNLNVKDVVEEMPNHIAAKKSYEEWLDFKNDSIIELLPLDFINSFLKKNIIYKSEEVVHLDEHHLVGNLKIISNKKIIIHETSSLKDILLVAPVIEILANSKHTAHFVVRDTLKIGKNSQLDFPSSIVVPDHNHKNPFLLFENNITFKGLINQFYTAKTESSIFPNIILSENSKIYGVIYNKGATSLKGTVYGSIITSEFLAQERGSLYRNYIINGEIRKPEWFPILALSLNKNSKFSKPIQWLY